MPHNNQNFIAIILAAGVGRRMKSQRPKVLHKIAGKPMIQRTIETIEALKPLQTIIVVNPNNLKEIQKIVPQNITLAQQERQLGTAHATMIGLKNAKDAARSIAVLYGDDTAFYKPQTIKDVFKLHLESKAKITFVTITKDNPEGLGRVVRKGGRLAGIIEEKDATQKQKKIKEVNDGLYFFDKKYLLDHISKLTPSKATGELYITDLIGFALKNKARVETYSLIEHEQWQGINTQLELARANFKLNKNIHIMGIAGAGASAVAGIAVSRGYNVSGCDTNTNFQYPLDTKINIAKGHSTEHLKGISTLIISPAVEKNDPQNPELLEARGEGLPVLTWEEFQGGVLQENKFVIAVAGAYGKSTTTALIGKILEDQKKDPTVEVGARILDWKSNFRSGTSNYYVCEADEYNNNFLSYKADISVVLNLAWDHPDFFKSKEEVYSSYTAFINNMKNHGVLVTTSQVAKLLQSRLRKDISVKIIRKYSDINLTIIGDFRKSNAYAALEVAKILELNIQAAKKSVTSFTGLGRRMEYKGQIGDVTFFDDYAVQPYTIKETANALKNAYKNRRILFVIQPHTFTRVHKFLSNFVESIKGINCEQIFITDIYAAREKGDPSRLSKQLAKLIGSKAKYTGNLKNTVVIVKKNLKSYDIICTMGAGDIFKIYENVKNGQ